MFHQPMYTCERRGWGSLLVLFHIAMLQGMPLSSEELTWLQANALIDPPMEGDDNSFLNNTCDSASLSTSISCDSYLPTPLTASSTPVGFDVSNSSELPRPEWIYRRPKTPIHARGHCTSSSPISSHFRGRTIASSSLSHSHFTARTGRSFDRLPSNDNTISYAVDPFLPTVFHSRPQSEQSFSPSFKKFKSQSDTGHNRTPSSPSRHKISSPKLVSVRPPSISSSSTSTSLSSSPRTPATPSSSIYTKTRRPLPYRRHPEDDSTLPPLSSSCPPSKSILTRTSSISTKESSFTGNKSVKFAAVPVVHYATASYWDLDNFDKEETTMGINVDAMDVDDSYHECRTHVSSGMLDIVKLRESQCATPTPERENAKTKGLKRLLSLTKKPLGMTTTSTSVATVYRSQLSPRPVISIPYALGTHPTSALQSDASLLYSAAGAADSAPDLVGILRSAQSLESFRSSATRSVRSMGSFKSSLSTRGLRGWLRRRTGWIWGGQPPER